MIPQDNVSETGQVLAWMDGDVICLHWIVCRFSKSLQRWETYDEADARLREEAGAPDNALVVNENDLPPKAARHSAIIREGRVVASPSWRLLQWQRKVDARLAEADAKGGPRAMREALAMSSPRIAHIEAWAVELRGLTWDGEGDEPPIPELGPFVERKPVIQEPERRRDDLLDFDDAIRDLPPIPDDLSQLMTGDETLGRAVERLTPGVDELLDMASALSESSLETAIATIPPERVNEWTEKLITEKARLRLLRGTDLENFPRENLVNRVQTMFAQVGAKR
jgi:hypothetical protein